MGKNKMEGSAFHGLIRLLVVITIVCAIGLPIWISLFGSPLAMLGWGVPDKVISFGYARPVSCAKKKFIDGYECVIKNHQDSIRHVRLACASFDSEGRAINSAYRISGAHEITMSAQEERIVGIPYRDGAKTIICSDTDSVYMYPAAMSMLAEHEAEDIASVLNLNKFSSLFAKKDGVAGRDSEFKAIPESNSNEFLVDEDGAKTFKANRAGMEAFLEELKGKYARLYRGDGSYSNLSTYLHENGRLRTCNTSRYKSIDQCRNANELQYDFVEVSIFEPETGGVCAGGRNHSMEVAGLYQHEFICIYPTERLIKFIDESGSQITSENFHGSAREFILPPGTPVFTKAIEHKGKATRIPLVFDEKSYPSKISEDERIEIDPCQDLIANFQRVDLPMGDRVMLMRELADCRRDHPETESQAQHSFAQQEAAATTESNSGQSEQRYQQEESPIADSSIENVANNQTRDEENDGPIVAVLQEMPPYPSAARRAGITGTVVVEATVDANGDVTSASLHLSSGNRDLDRAALQAARRWKYSKSRNGGKLRASVDFGNDQVSSSVTSASANNASCPSENIQEFVRKFRDSISIQRNFTISGFSHTSLDENMEVVTEVKRNSEIDFPIMVSSREASGIDVDFSIANDRATVHEQGVDSGISATYVFEKREGCWYLVSLEDLST